MRKGLLQINKIPNTSENVVENKTFAKMPKLYLELVENKNKILPNLVNKEYDYSKDRGRSSLPGLPEESFLSRQHTPVQTIPLSVRMDELLRNQHPIDHNIPRNTLTPESTDSALSIDSVDSSTNSDMSDSDSVCSVESHQSQRDAYRTFPVEDRVHGGFSQRMATPVYPTEPRMGSPYSPDHTASYRGARSNDDHRNTTTYSPMSSPEFINRQQNTVRTNPEHFRLPTNHTSANTGSDGARTHPPDTNPTQTPRPFGLDGLDFTVRDEFANPLPSAFGISAPKDLPQSRAGDPLWGSRPEPPSLQELNMNTAAMPSLNNFKSDEEQDDLKRELLFKFELLKKSYKEASIPDFSMHSDYSSMKQAYDRTLKRLSIESSVDSYKTYLIGGFMLVEYGLGNYMGFDMKGFTQQQIVSMSQYERLLIELGEKSYVEEESQWPVELRLFGLIIMQAVFFVVSKLIAKKTGSNLLNMINSMNMNNQVNNQDKAKKRMRGPTINLDELPTVG
jgi:hypothetical protein